MGILDDCIKYFGTKDLYNLFDVPENANERDLKKAYHKLSLKVHPDKAETDNKTEANRRFQIVTKAYFILCDKDKRAIYDDQGEVEEDDIPQDKDWLSYWRLLFPKITMKDIDNFKKKYRGSEEEQEDLKEYYTRFEGDIEKMCEFMPCYELEEESRYKEILEAMIKNDHIKEYPAFTAIVPKAMKLKKLKKAQREAEEAEVMRKELGLDDLASAITQRQSIRKNGFDDLINSLEAKYSNPQTSKRGRKK